MANDVTIEVGSRDNTAADFAALSARLEEVKKRIKAAGGNIDVNTAAGRLQADKLRVALDRLDRTIKPEISLRGADRALLQLDALDVAADKLNKKASGLGKTLTGAFAKLGAGIGAGAGGVAGAGAGVAMASPIAAATIAIGAFGAVAYPVIKKVATAQSALNSAQQAYAQATTKAQRLSALKAEQKATDGLTASEKGLLGPLGQLKTMWGQVESKLSPVVAQVLKLAISVGRDLMPSFSLLARAGAKVVDAFLTPLNTLLKSPFWARFSADLAKIAVQAGNILGPALVKLLKVFMTLFIQIMPSGIKLLGILLPALVGLFKAMVPGLVIMAKVVTATVEWLKHTHLLIPALITLGAVVVAITGASGIAGIGIAIALVALAIGALAKNWKRIWTDIKNWTVDAWHWLYNNVFAKLITFFTKTIPTAFDIWKESVRIVWDDIKILFLKGALAITTTMGHLPGPLGAPFRKASTDIRGSLNKIEGDVRDASRNIQDDWNKLHGKRVALTFGLNLPAGVSYPSRHIKGRAKGGGVGAGGTFLVGEEGPELVHLPQGAHVMSNPDTKRVMGGLASGTGFDFTDRFSPSVGGFLGRLNSAFGAAENAIISAVRKRAQYSGSLGGSVPGYGIAPSGPLQSYARRLLAAYGWSSQWPEFNDIVMRESGWNVFAQNPSSGAYGIPQALPGSKMASAGADWRTNGFTQLRWMMSYIRQRWIDPVGADLNERMFHWYGSGFHGTVSGPTLMGVGERGRERVDITPAGQGGPTVVLEMRGGSGLERELWNWLLKQVRVKGGGDVQIAFGRS